MSHRASRHCGAIGLEDGSILWRLWAPRARRVDLVLIDGGHRRSIEMTPHELGYFEHHAADIRRGQRYTYRLDGGAERPDPASTWQPDGVFGPSAVFLPEHFAWRESWTGIPRADLVFYELHVGTFTPEGTFDAVIPRLRSLKELGITAIEIMPVAQFPGMRGWGYDGIYLYAPQNSYGGPEGLRRLVEACHAEGLAAFLDVVYNHVGPEGNFLNEFGPYFADRYRTGWGPAFNYDSAGCDPVRDFVTDNVRMWIHDYHLDGLRLDAVHAIYDFGPHHILRAIKEAADCAAADRGCPACIVAESDLNDIRILLLPERGGYGLDAQWSDDFHHSVHALLTGEQEGYYADFGKPEDLAKSLEETFVLGGTYSQHRQRRHGASADHLPGDRFVVAIQNHDQVGNRARGDRLNQLLEPAAQRLAASLLLTAPHLPLLFMGEEYAEPHPFQFFCSFQDLGLIQAVREGRQKEFESFTWQGEVPDPQAESTFQASRLTWSWPEGSVQAGMRYLYQDLLAARRSWPALKDYTHRSASLQRRQTGFVLKLVRGDASDSLVSYFNLTKALQPLPEAPPGNQTRLFSSEDARYQGARTSDTSSRQLLPYECQIIGPTIRG